MNKADLIEQIIEDTGINKKLANDVINSITNAIIETLKKGDKVTIVDFGTFSVLHRAAREGRNPRPDAPPGKIPIKAKRVAKFKAGKKLSVSI